MLGPVRSYNLFFCIQRWFSITNQVLTAGPQGMIVLLKWFRPDVDNGMDKQKWSF